MVINTLEERILAMTIVAEKYAQVIGVDTHARPTLMRLSTPPQAPAQAAKSSLSPRPALAVRLHGSAATPPHLSSLRLRERRHTVRL